jgi:nucleoside-diphosphate-sugar epimerase
LRIVVTGSNGIIGREVLCQLKLFYPKADIYQINRKKIENNDKSFSIDLLNVNNEEISKILNNIRPNLLFHLAWYTDHKDYLTSSLNKSWETATINLINAFYNSGGEKFIGLGSSIEYDWNFQSPFKENSIHLNGNKWAYGEAKTNVFKYLNSLKGISFQWDRVFFVFGPGQSKSRLIPLIIDNAINGGTPLKVNLNLRRDYISTFEIAKQIANMSTTSFSGSLNICSGRSILLSDLVSKIEILTNKKISISANKFIDNFDVENIYGRQDIIKSYFPNYNYSEFDFNEDLKKTIKYYK